MISFEELKSHFYQKVFELKSIERDPTVAFSQKEILRLDCDGCLQFMTTCDVCHCAGHTDSLGWYGEEIGDGNVRTYCTDCVPKNLT